MAGQGGPGPDGLNQPGRVEVPHVAVSAVNARDEKIDPAAEQWLEQIGAERSVAREQQAQALNFQQQRQGGWCGGAVIGRDGLHGKAGEIVLRICRQKGEPLRRYS